MLNFILRGAQLGLKLAANNSRVTATGAALAASLGLTSTYNALASINHEPVKLTAEAQARIASGELKEGISSRQILMPSILSLAGSVSENPQITQPSISNPEYHINPGHIAAFISSGGGTNALASIWLVDETERKKFAPLYAASAAHAYKQYQAATDPADKYRYLSEVFDSENEYKYLNESGALGKFPISKEQLEGLADFQRKNYFTILQSLGSRFTGSSDIAARAEALTMANSLFGLVQSDNKLADMHALFPGATIVRSESPYYDGKLTLNPTDMGVALSVHHSIVSSNSFSPSTLRAELALTNSIGTLAHISTFADKDPKATQMLGLYSNLPLGTIASDFITRNNSEQFYNRWLERSVGLKPPSDDPVSAPVTLPAAVRPPIPKP